MSDECRLLAQYDVQVEHGGKIWNKLVERAQLLGGAFPEWLVTTEENLLIYRNTKGIDIFHKNGKVNKSTMFDHKEAYATYRSAKSTLLSALKNGISLTGTDGEILGKSVITKSIADLAVPTVKTDSELIQSCLTVVMRTLERLGASDREQLLAGINALET